MAQRCDYCHKGIGYGHAVSHAKNRVGRFFRPNLQKLKVLKNGITVRVKFCTRCMKRLRKDKKLGRFAPVRSSLSTATPDLDKLLKKAGVKPREPEKKEEKGHLQLEAIVGKKS